MAHFSKSSKYRNAIVNSYKRELWVNDLRVGSNLKPNGNHIKASCNYVAFVQDSTSIGSLAVLPIGVYGRFTTFPLITGHGGRVTDFDFSPFNHELLATGSDDGVIKLWQIPNDLNNNVRLSESALNLGPFDDIESLQFHPSANSILAASWKNMVQIFDIDSKTNCLDLNAHEDTVESISWHGSGQFLSTICKKGTEKSVKVFDPREGKSCVFEANYHSGFKPSLCLFLSDSDYLVTAGSNKMREAELVMWSTKNMSKPLCKQNLGTTSSGSPSVLYDNDTKMLFAALKGESTITFYDCSTSTLVPGQAYHGLHQTKGIAIIPKMMVDVMSCEVARLLQLTQNAVVPISYHVQRKSHSEFHADLYPDTSGDVPAMSSKQWLQGSNALVSKISLDPKKRAKRKVVEEPKIEEKTQVSESLAKNAQTTLSVPAGACATSVSAVSPEPPVSSTSTTTSCTPKRVAIVRSSKFRHIEGKARHSSTYITKIPALSSTVPGDSNAFQANRKRVGVVLSVAGGQIGLFELTKPGRLDTAAVPTLQNGSPVMDFAFDPFNFQRIVVACEDAKIRIWTIPESGLSETLIDPEYLIGHHDKANILAFHPQTMSLLASAGYDGQIILWDISCLEIVLSLDKLDEPLFCMTWSPKGDQLATLGKDHFVRIFEPRSSLSSIVQLRGPEGSRGARIVWLEADIIAVSGFTKSSLRTVNLYNVGTGSHLSEISTSIAPATLIPYYDCDTKLLFLSGKGDNTILAYEYVRSEAPYLFEVAPLTFGAHQSVAFLPKVLCDVTKVEIAVGVRLTRNSVEGFTVQVPRTRLNYFQDDLYPDTLCIEEAAITLDEWLKGGNDVQKLCSLKPLNMKPLSDAPKEAPAAKKFTSYNPKYKSDDQKKEELLSAMIDRMGDKEDDPLPQHTMDGVDSDEWSD